MDNKQLKALLIAQIAAGDFASRGCYPWQFHKDWDLGRYITMAEDIMEITGND